jgi:transposase
MDRATAIASASRTAVPQVEPGANTRLPRVTTISGGNRQATLLPECLDDYVAPDNPVRIIDAFVDEFDLAALGFAGVVPGVTGPPAYHPATLLKIYIYDYLNRIPSTRRPERETQRNLELIWLTSRLMPHFKTIADFRHDNGPAIRATCAQSTHNNAGPNGHDLRRAEWSSRTRPT